MQKKNIYINAPGHMTKMATMSIKSKMYVLQNRTRWPIILELGMKHAFGQLRVMSTMVTLSLYNAIRPLGPANSYLIVGCLIGA